MKKKPDEYARGVMAKLPSRFWANYWEWLAPFDCRATMPVHITPQTA